MLFSLLKLYLHIDTALKVSQSVYCFTTSISHGVVNYFSRLWGNGISDAIFFFLNGDSIVTTTAITVFWVMVNIRSLWEFRAIFRVLL